MNANALCGALRILCKPLSFAILSTGFFLVFFFGLPGAAMAQDDAALDFEVVMEPGQTFAPGWILTSPRFSGNLTYPIIVSASGEVVYNSLHPYMGWNFDQHPSGVLTWYNQFDPATTGWQLLDSGLVSTQTLQIQDGQLDFHDVEISNNGQVLLMGYENVDVVLTDSITDLAFPDRVVKECILEEQDLEGNVTWTWRASEHIPVTWCTSCNWSFPLLDAYHHNSFQTQENGDILLSLRNMNMVVMIDRETDEVLWHLGGPESDFTFADASDAFVQQHDAQMLSGNRVLLFDNGTSGVNGFARGVEYELDFDLGTASLVASWNHPELNSAPSQGSIQRLEDGGTLIGWGTASSEDYNGGMVSEFGPEGDLRGTLYFPLNHYSYRARKVLEGALPLHMGCGDIGACNYHPQDVVNTSCIQWGDSCDDGDFCTLDDQIQEDCSCQGVLEEVDPEANQCLDENAVNFNPCPTSEEDDGSCLFGVTFRADASAWDSVPTGVTLSIDGSVPLDMIPGGFGTWHAEVLLGMGVWTFGFEVDGATDGVLRTLDGAVLEWDQGEEVRSCLGISGTACPGCSDPDDVAYSPFSEGDEQCGASGASGCTYPEAQNFSPLAFFEDGTCVFENNDCAQDINGDGLIGVADILDLLSFFGVVCD